MENEWPSVANSQQSPSRQEQDGFLSQTWPDWGKAPGRQIPGKPTIIICSSTDKARATQSGYEANLDMEGLDNDAIEIGLSENGPYAAWVGCEGSNMCQQ